MDGDVVSVERVVPAGPAAIFAVVAAAEAGTRGVDKFMLWSARAMGRPGFMHGGAIGGVLEMAGFTALEAELERQGIDMRIKPINISTEYLRGGLPETIYARGEVVRAGRRVANVRIEAWQSDRSRPVASCWMNFQLSPKKA